MNFRRWAGVAVMVLVWSLGSGRGLAAPAWPDGTPEQIREDIFGVRFRQIREIDGPRAGLEFLRKEIERAPTPPAKAYYAWISLFSEGWGYPQMKDVARGQSLAEEAAKEGSVVAKDVLARAKGMKLIPAESDAEVNKLLADAAAEGSTRSMARLGYYRAIGYGGPADVAEANRLARRAAELGQPIGLVEIGQAYEAGAIGDKPDLTKALEYYYEAGGHAEPEAWKKLQELEAKNVPQARLYRALVNVREANRAGWLVPARVREHVKVLAEVAGNHPQALVELGRAYTDGKYASRDYKLAHDHFERAAAQGNVDAQFFLARMRLDGLGETAQPAEALATIRRLAEQGNGEAGNYLGYIYYWAPSEAKGVKKNPEMAFQYVRQAAEKGHPAALLNLGFCYENGIGTPINYPLAAKIYWQAYLRGYAEGRARVRSLMAFIK